MIITQIRGGLGNQFFGYATSYALAHKKNTKLILDDYRYATSYKLRDFQLLDYNITYRDTYSNKPSEGKIAQVLYRVWARIKRYILNRCIVVREEKEFQTMKFDFPASRNAYLLGYWQSHEYFDQYRADLQSEFTLSNVREDVAEAAKEIKHGNYCAVHVRRGDYSTFKGGKCLDESYYLEAISIIKRKNPDSKFLFFSDDLDYCKSELMDDRSETVEYLNASDEEELFLMSNCSSFIIANSSFSWWGAYLSNNLNSQVICPVVDMWKRSFYPDTWTPIDAKIRH